MVTEALARLAGPWTFADLERLPEDGQRYEIVEGSLLVSPPPAPTHQLAVARIARVLAAAVGPDFEVVEATGMQLPDGVLVPDVLVVRLEAFGRAAQVLQSADVVLAVEVVSPSSRTTDRVTKPALYAAAGIPWYWRVELDEPTVVIHELHGSAYAETLVVTGSDVADIEHPVRLHLVPAHLIKTS